MMALQTIAGSVSGTSGNTDGYGTDSRFNLPRDIALSADGRTLYIADYNNSSVRAMDLDTGYVSTLTASLATKPSHLTIDSRLWATGGTHIYGIDPADGSLDVDYTAGGTVGAIAKMPNQSYWICKYPLGGYSTGWSQWDGVSSLVDDGGYNDGAYGADAGLIAAGGRVWRIHEYSSPSGSRFSDGVSLISPYLTTLEPLQLAIEPWSPEGYIDLIGPVMGNANMTRYRVTTTAYVSATGGINWGFSTYDCRGIAIDPNTHRIYFSTRTHKIQTVNVRGQLHSSYV